MVLPFLSFPLSLSSFLQEFLLWSYFICIRLFLSPYPSSFPIFFSLTLLSSFLLWPSHPLFLSFYFIHLVLHIYPLCILFLSSFSFCFTLFVFIPSLSVALALPASCRPSSILFLLSPLYSFLTFVGSFFPLYPFREYPLLLFGLFTHYLLLSLFLFVSKYL